LVSDFPPLSESDLSLLARLSGMDMALLRADPERVEALLQTPALDALLFSAHEPLLLASPRLVFRVLVNRALRHLQEAAFVEEWVGPGRRVPVFDVEALRTFVTEPSHRGMLAELLASYTRVASGSFWIRTARGWRRRRYSELDPVRLASLLEVVPAAERAAVYRRLGDLALFLSGVFPEHTLRHPLPPRQVELLRRMLQGGPGPDEALRAGPAAPVGLWVLEWLGCRAYGLADMDEVAAGFRAGRRFLNLLAWRYLMPSRERWFPAAGG
jgi:hypothetical protein